MERNSPTVRAPIAAPLRVALGALAFAVAILPPSAALAQRPSPSRSLTVGKLLPVTIRRIIEMEVDLCRRTDTATAAQLTGVEADIQQAMTAVQQRVDRLLADSTALAQGVTRAKTKFDELETRVGQLQVARNDAAARLKPLDEKIAAAEGASGSGTSRHDQLMAQETNHRQRIQMLQEEVKKANKAMEGMSTIQAAAASEGPIADLRKAEQDLAAVMDELRAIRRQTHPIRYSADYVDLRAKWEKADEDARSAELDRESAKKEIDAAQLEMSKFDAAALGLAHDENLYAYEHLYRAKHCVEKRRKELNRPVADTPAPAPQPTAGSASGKWSVTCKYTDPEMKDTKDGGPFSISITPTGSVSGTYVSDKASYPVTGQVAADGSAVGQGSGPDWSVSWSGNIQRTAGGATGSGSVSVNVSNFGGGTCTGGWSIP